MPQKKEHTHTANPGIPKQQPEVWLAYDALRKDTKRCAPRCVCTKCKQRDKLLGKLVEIHRPLAYRFLGRFLAKWSHFGDVPLDDARQAACIGLMRAIERIDVTKGKFAAYVFLWVRLELTRCAESFGIRVKKLPLKAADYRKVVDFEIRHGRQAEPSDLPEISPKKLKDAQARVHFTEIDEDHISIEYDMEDLLDRKRTAESLNGLDQATSTSQVWDISDEEYDFSDVEDDEPS